MPSLDNLLASGAATLETVTINATSDGANTLVAAVAGRKIRVVNYMITATGAGTLVFQDTDATEKGRLRVGGDGGGASFDGEIAFEVDAGKGVQIVNPAGVDTFGHLAYVRL